MPARFTTAPQRENSWRMKASNCADVPPAGSAPCAAKPGRMSGRLRILAKFAVEPIDDRLRRACGRYHSIPQRDIHIAVAQLRECRDVGQAPVAGGARGRQRPQLVGQDERQQCRHRVEHDGDAPGDDIDYGRSAAAIGDMQQIGAGQALEQLTGEVRCAAIARRREGELAGLRLRQRNHARQPMSPAGSALTVMIKGKLASNMMGEKSSAGSYGRLA